VLRITKQTDYGIMLLAHMASLPDGRVLSARDAAAWSGLSLPMVSKILKSLAKQNVVVSHRGVGGGYALARPAQRTTVADVIRALEGPISMVECGARPGNCEHEPTCRVRIHWGRISREVERALESVPISEMFAACSSSALLPVGTCGAKSEPARPVEDTVGAPSTRGSEGRTP
jgi:FeS assembly SUF system regulator